jgi:hypothetical protein
VHTLDEVGLAVDQVDEIAGELTVELLRRGSGGGGQERWRRITGTKNESEGR